MKVDTQRADARTRQIRQQGQREATTEEAARRFQKQLQRRRKEEDASKVGIAGPFELMVRLRDWLDDPQAIGMPLHVPTQTVSEQIMQPTPDLAPWVDPEVVQRQQQDSLRMDSIARAAMDAGVQAAMAQDSGEYQVELGSVLFTRTRLRVRAAEDLGIEVRCESDDASEREWFAHHRETLADRMAGLTGRAVRLDIAGIGP
jgi:hypothetical protein